MAGAAAAETSPPVPRLSAEKLDALAEERQKLGARIAEINEQVIAQVEAHGFTPARADKSKRLLGEQWQATLSYGESTEIRDAQVETIRKACSAGLFPRLFREVKQYRLTSGASMLLAGTLPEGAPSNLRKLFAAAVIIKPKWPSLRIEPLREGNGGQ